MQRLERGQRGVDVRGVQPARQFDDGDLHASRRERLLQHAGRQPHRRIAPDENHFTATRALTAKPPDERRACVGTIALDHFAVRAHLLDVRVDAFEQFAHLGIELLKWNGIRHTVISSRHESLTEQHGEPAVAREEAILVVRDMAARLRRAASCAASSAAAPASGHGPTAAGRATIRHVVKDEEVADALVERIGTAVELIAQAVIRELACSAHGHESQQILDRPLNQKNARGLERLEESAREPDAHAIALPCMHPPPGAEAQQLAARRAPCRRAGAAESRAPRLR